MLFVSLDLTNNWDQQSYYILLVYDDVIHDDAPWLQKNNLQATFSKLYTEFPRLSYRYLPHFHRFLAHVSSSQVMPLIRRKTPISSFSLAWAPVCHNRHFPLNLLGIWDRESSKFSCTGTLCLDENCCVESAIFMMKITAQTTTTREARHSH